MKRMTILAIVLLSIIVPLCTSCSKESQKALEPSQPLPTELYCGKVVKKEYCSTPPSYYFYVLTLENNKSKKLIEIKTDKLTKLELNQDTCLSYNW